MYESPGQAFSCVWTILRARMNVKGVIVQSVTQSRKYGWLLLGRLFLENSFKIEPQNDGFLSYRRSLFASSVNFPVSEELTHGRYPVAWIVTVWHIH